MLRFGSPCGHDQSTLRLAEPSAVLAEYLRIATLGLALARRHERILMLGLGGGVWTNLVSRVLPGAHIAAVDIDPLVVWIAQRYFGFEVTERYRLHVADALDFARSARGRYDVVFVDLYTDEGTPAHLATREFFEAAGALLRPSGVLVANFGLGRAEAYLRSAGTLGDALGAVACVSAESEANLVAFAGTPDVLAVDAAVARSAELDGELDLGFALAPIAQRLRPCGR